MFEKRTHAILAVLVLIAALGILDPPMMMDPLLKGFASGVLGGMTSLPGTAVGGAMLGIIENLFWWIRFFSI